MIPSTFFFDKFHLLEGIGPEVKGNFSLWFWDHVMMDPRRCGLNSMFSWPLQMVLSRANFIFQDKLENVAEHQVLEEGGHRCDNSYALMTIKTAKVVYYLLNKLGSTAVKAWSRPTTISNWFFNHYFFWVHIHKQRGQKSMEFKNGWKLNVNSRMTWEYCWRVGVKVLLLQAAAHLSRSSNLQEQDDLDLYYCLYLAHSLPWTKGLEKYLYCTQKKQLFGVDIGRTAAAISISFL